MGRRVTFYAVEQDFASLLGFAQDLGLLALPRIVPTDVYDLGQVEALSPLQRQDEGGFYLIPEEVPVAEAFYKEFDKDPSRSYLMPHVSPVIKTGPCRREGDELYHSRIYIEAPRQGPGADCIYKIYGKLARYIRKWTKVEEGTYAGPVTIELVKDGKLRLMVIGGRELEVTVDEETTE